MQGSFFSDAIDDKEGAIQCLKNREFAQARVLFQRAADVDPFLAEIDSYLKITDFLAEKFAENPTNSDVAVQALDQIRSDLYAGRCNLFVANYLEQFCSELILEQLSNDFNDFVTFQQFEFHVGYLLYVSQDYQTAREKLIKYLDTPGGRFHARLWGYLGDVNYILKFHREAEIAYMNAFLLDPLQVDMQKLKHKEILEIFKHEKNTFLNEAYAQQFIPIACWQKHVFTIPHGQNFLTGYAEKLLDQPYAKHQKYHRFALCLLIDQAGYRDDMDFRTREEMQRLDPELFQKYLERVSLY